MPSGSLLRLMLGAAIKEPLWVLRCTMLILPQSTYEMRSMVLGVRRFKHSNTGEAIAKKLLSMLNEFGIRSKVQNIVTDNAANFAKAFKVSVDAAEVHEGTAYDYSNESGGEVDEIRT